MNKTSYKSFTNEKLLNYVFFFCQQSISFCSDIMIHVPENGNTGELDRCHDLKVHGRM